MIQHDVAWIQVDVDAIAHSAHGLKDCVGERMHVMADEEITAEEVACLAQTINYEVATAL